MKYKFVFLISIFFMLGVKPIYSMDQFVSMKVGETKTFTFPSEVSSRSSSMTSYYPYSDHINCVDVISYTTSSITVKAIAFTQSRVAVQFHYSWNDNGTPRSDIHTVHIDLNDDSHSVSDPDMNPWNYDFDQGCWDTINLEQGMSKTVYCDFDIPDKNKVKSIVWSDVQENGGGTYFGYSIISQDNSSCTIKGTGSIYDQKLYCLMKYGSNTFKAYYTVNITPSTKETLSLTANPNGGVIEKGKTVTLNTTSGANIFYTLNGAMPTTNSSKYSSAGIPINEPCTLKAFAQKSGYLNSPVMTWVFTIDEGPSIEINEENFPDNNFRNYLLSQSYGKDGKISESEIQNAKIINIYGMNIRSLKGIEYFTALTDLICSNNQLTSLDISKNTALTLLYCGVNQLTNLDVSKNTALMKLDCEYNQLVNLNVSKNTALTRLSCYNNPLTALDVSKNTALTDLCCSYCQITTLDVTKNRELTELDCSENQLISLNVTNNTMLTRLWCYENQLAVLDVSNNTMLTQLRCGDNQLTTIDVSKNTKLTELGCSHNLLLALDVSRNTSLTYISCQRNKIMEKEMNILIQSMPTNKTDMTYHFYVYDKYLSEGNTFTKTQAAAVKAKGWTPMCRDGNSWTWVECDGHDPSGINDVQQDNPSNSVVYIISGQKLKKPRKGINIIDGKKVVLK